LILWEPSRQNYLQRYREHLVLIGARVMKKPRGVGWLHGLAPLHGLLIFLLLQPGEHMSGKELSIVCR
jgi:hypothetical protein